MWRITKRVDRDPTIDRGTIQAMAETMAKLNSLSESSGALVEVLQTYAGRTRPFTLLYPHGRHVSLRVRTFVEFLLESFAGRKAA